LEKSHSHLIIRARVTNPPTDTTFIEQWTRDVIHAVGMQVLMGPYAVYSNVPGNEGVTCIGALDFSHIAIHIWDQYEEPLIEFDLFSCKSFDPQIVIDMMHPFGVKSLTIKHIDRDEMEKKSVEDYFTVAAEAFTSVTADPH